MFALSETRSAKADCLYVTYKLDIITRSKIVRPEGGIFG